MKSKFLSASSFVLFALLAGCGGGGGGGNDLDLAGNWNGTARIESSNCGGVGQSSNFNTTIIQSGKTVKFTNETGTQFNATLNGSNLSFDGTATQTQGSCTATVQYSGTATVTETRIQGSVNTHTQISGPTPPCFPINCTVQVSYNMTR